MSFLFGTAKIREVIYELADVFFSSSFLSRSHRTEHWLWSMRGISLRTHMNLISFHKGFQLEAEFQNGLTMKCPR